MPYGFLFKILQLITVYANKYSQSFFLDIFLSFTFWHSHNLLSLKNNSKFCETSYLKLFVIFLYARSFSYPAEVHFSLLLLFR